MDFLARVIGFFKNKRVLIAIPFVLLLILALFFLFRSCAAPSLPRNYDSYSHAAFTDCRGEEYVYKNGDPIFAEAAAAFSTATRASKKPAWATREGMIVLDWIRDGYAHRYRLYLSRTSFSAYLEDENENGYFLSESGATFLYETEAALPSLIGAMPPALTANGEKMDFAIASWHYELTDAAGKVHKIFSADYLGGADTVKILENPSGLQLTFEKRPDSTRYNLYLLTEGGTVYVSTDKEIPPLGTLPPAKYQLVVTAEYKNGSVTTRAGYSFIFEKQDR